MPQVLTYVKPENRRVAISASIPAAKLKKGKEISAQKGISFSRLLEIALDEYIKKAK